MSTSQLLCTMCACFFTNHNHNIFGGGIPQSQRAETKIIFYMAIHNTSILQTATIREFLPNFPIWALHTQNILALVGVSGVSLRPEPVLHVTKRRLCMHASMCKRSVMGLRPTTVHDHMEAIHTSKHMHPLNTMNQRSVVGLLHTTVGLQPTTLGLWPDFQCLYWFR